MNSGLASSTRGSEPPPPPTQNLPRQKGGRGPAELLLLTALTTPRVRLFPDITGLSSSLDACQGYGNRPVPTLPAGALEDPQAAALQTSSPLASAVPGPQGTLPCAPTGCRVCGVLTRDPTQEQQREETHRASGGGGVGAQSFGSCPRAPPSPSPQQFTCWRL